MDNRKNIKVQPNTKRSLESLRSKITFKTDSETLAYLLLVHDWAFAKMPTAIYFDAIAKAKELDRQQSF